MSEYEFFPLGTFDDVPLSAGAPADIISVRQQDATEIIRIGPDGRIFWRGREVETDDDFRGAMMDLAAVLAGSVGNSKAP